MERNAYSLNMAHVIPLQHLLLQPAGPKKENAEVCIVQREQKIHRTLLIKSQQLQRHTKAGSHASIIEKVTDDGQRVE